MEPESKSPIPESAAVLKARVLYADTDRMGVVYHGNYFRWFEAARAHYMRVRGSTYADVERKGLFLPVVEAHAEYLKPALYDELLEIAAWISDIGRAQIRFSYVISRDGKELVRGYTRHVAVNGEGKPTRLPAEIPQALMGPETEAADSLVQ